MLSSRVDAHQIEMPTLMPFFKVDTDKNISKYSKYQMLKQVERRGTADKTHLKTHEHIQNIHKVRTETCKARCVCHSTRERKEEEKGRE